MHATQLSLSIYCVLIVPKEVGGRVYKYLHERAIYNVLTLGRTVQKGGSNPPRENHTL